MVPFGDYLVIETQKHKEKNDGHSFANNGTY